MLTLFWKHSLTEVSICEVRSYKVSPSQVSSREVCPFKEGISEASRLKIGISSTQADAQAVLDAEPGDRHRRDGNNDGVACKSLP
jgi:hypothetical protein